jgi:hypothetical protein
MQEVFELAIISIANAIMIGADLSQIHDALINKGWSEDEIFLLIKAAEILVQDRL